MIDDANANSVHVDELHTLLQNAITNNHDQTIQDQQADMTSEEQRTTIISYLEEQVVQHEDALEQAEAEETQRQSEHTVTEMQTITTHQTDSTTRTDEISELEERIDEQNTIISNLIS